MLAGNPHLLGNELRSTVKLNRDKAFRRSPRMELVVDEHVSYTVGPLACVALQQRRGGTFSHSGWITSKYLGYRFRCRSVKGLRNALPAF